MFPHDIHLFIFKNLVVPSSTLQNLKQLRHEHDKDTTRRTIMLICRNGNGQERDDVDNSHRARDPDKTQAYLIGGGIASVAAAVTLMHEAKVHPTNIHIIESSDILGGSMDAAGSPETGYSMRGGRMLNFSYLCLYDLLRQIPSLTDDKKSVLQEIEEFNDEKGNKTYDRARLVRHHVHADGRESAQFDDGRKFGMSGGDRLKLVKVMMQPEHSLGQKTIRECFNESFFKSNFWVMWCSM